MNEIHSVIQKFLQARGNTVELLENSQDVLIVTRDRRPWYIISSVKCGFSLFTEVKGEGITPEAKEKLLELTCNLSQESEIARWSIVENENINGKAFVPGPFDPIASEPLFTMWENDLDLFTDSLNSLFKPLQQSSTAPT